MRAAPAAKNVLDAIEVLRGMNTDNARKLPADAPTGFIAALAETGDDRRRHRPALLRTVRAVRVEELPALGRHLGAGFTPVQGLRGLPGTAREVHQPQAVQRIAAGRGHRLRTISA